MDANAPEPPTVHIPVMAGEILELGEIAPGQTWVDGTAGGGGHARLISQRVGPHGKLLAVDRDPQAVARLEGQLPENVVVRNASYHELPSLLKELGWESVDGILVDLGLSSDQLADRERGFSFQTEGELDMRFNPTQGVPAWQWLQQATEKQIADVIYQYGEERFSRRIARRIVETRQAGNAVKTADALRELIYRSAPRGQGKSKSRPASKRGSSQARRHGNVDPATRTFQALRIQVNDELKILEAALDCFPELLALGGKLAVISFHSLEDRITKYAFRQDERLKILTKKPVQAAAQEVQSNPRSRSAKLRVAERVEPPPATGMLLPPLNR